MRRTALAVCCMLSGCTTYLGTAQDWDPRSAADGFSLISGLDPIRQASSTGCGAAALTMILRFHGEPVGDEELHRKLSPADESGVAARSLRDLARSLGYKAHVIEGTLADIDEHLHKGRPLIVGLVKPFATGARRHYEVVAGFNPVQRTIATIDPARGWTLNTVEGFLEEWAGSGRVLLVIAPAPPAP